MTLRVNASWLLALALLWSLAAGTALAQEAPMPDSPPSEESAEQRESKERFFRALELFEAKDWGAALAEFERSRALFPTRAATRNAAICLKNLARYAEALTLFEHWTQAFPEAPKEEQALVQEELATLAKLVGSLTIVVSEPGAAVFVDAVERGRSPLPQPLRVSAGTRLVQVYKDGYLALQTQASVAGAAHTKVDLELRPLAQSGRLRVREIDAKPAELWVDGIRVGHTPWEGALPPGSHYVVLVAAGDLGSQPVAAPVRLGDVTALTVALEPIPAAITVSASPPGAQIAIDGVSVGRGSFRGRVRLGKHRIEVGLEGYVPEIKELDLRAPGVERVEVKLERDRTSPVWNAAAQPRFALSASVGPLLGPTLGGAAAGEGCSGECSASPAYGALALGSLGYRWPLGVTIGADLGYLGLFQRVVDRSATLFEQPDALRRDEGRVDDSLALQGLLAGFSLAVDGGEKWVWRARLFTGLLAANAADRRLGRFAPEGGGLPYATQSYGENERALSLALIPEAHLGYRLSKQLEIGVGLAPVLLIGLEEPMWRNERDVLGPDFLGYYQEEPLVGDVVFAVAPTLGLSGLF